LPLPFDFKEENATTMPALFSGFFGEFLNKINF
jgi:hypothetical protein